MTAETEAGVKGRPLSGLTIVVTRAAGEGASRFADTLRAMGAEVIEFPTIEIAPLADYGALDSAIARLDAFDWVIFTSVNGVDAFIARLTVSGRVLDALRRHRLGAIGPATAKRLTERGLRVAAMPSEYRAEAITDAIGENQVPGARFLIPRAAVARDALPHILTEKGAAEVCVVPAYRTVVGGGALSDALRRSLAAADLLTFTSSSTVENFCTIVGPPEPGRKAAAIGPITAETARARGFNVVAMPADYTIAGLAVAIHAWAVGAGRQ